MKIVTAYLHTGTVKVKVINLNPRPKVKSVFEGECIYSTCPLNKVGTIATNWCKDAFKIKY